MDTQNLEQIVKKTKDKNIAKKLEEQSKQKLGTKIINWIEQPRKLSLGDKIFFVKQLGVMIKAGISLSIALKTLSNQAGSKTFKKVLTTVQQEVEKGNLLSAGLKKYEKLFGGLFISMIEAGEASGKLEDVLNQLFLQMKKDHEIVSKVRGAMIYPSIVIVMMVAIGILMMVFVIPTLTGVFTELNVQLPLPTRVLIFISNATVQYGIFMAIGFAALVVALNRIISTKSGKRKFHNAMLKTPILGKIIKKINLARFCRSMSSLLKTDIPIIKSFEITSKILGNVKFKDALLEAREKIKKGVSINDALGIYDDLFPPVVMQMIAVGEDTGALDDILEESAIFYENEVSQTMENLPSIIEPLLMVCLGIGVGGMAVAVIMPLYALSESI